MTPPKKKDRRGQREEGMPRLSYKREIRELTEERDDVQESLEREMEVSRGLAKERDKFQRSAEYYADLYDSVKDERDGLLRAREQATRIAAINEAKLRAMRNQMDDQQEYTRRIIGERDYYARKLRKHADPDEGEALFGNPVARFQSWLNKR